MAFCIMNTENGGGYTLVDNAFLRDFMPFAPPTALKIYLFGLCLAGRDDDVNNIEYMKRTLNVTEDDILDAFTYWEECGLVNIAAKDQIKIEYVGSSSRSLLKKVSAAKYKNFNKQMQQVLNGRMISVNEYNEYYTFLENSFFEPDALVQIAKYCAEIKGSDIGYAYILKIARDYDKAGIKTVEKIREKLETQNYYNEELKEVLLALNIKRKIDLEDRQLYARWTQELGFSKEVILFAAKSAKKQGINKLDSLLKDYYKLNLFSVKEIEDFNSAKDQHVNLAKGVNRNLGLYYSDLSAEIEEYIMPWLNMGFSPLTIETLARFCFKCRIQTLSGMDMRLKSLYEKGLVSEEAIFAYTEDVLASDKQIAKILDVLGVVRNVCAADRKNFKMWISWGLSIDVIMFAAEKCNASFNPMASLNKLLADLKRENATDLESAKKYAQKNVFVSADKQKEKSNDFLLATDRTYTAEQLKAMFDGLEDF
jgi:hypothetical protein